MGQKWLQELQCQARPRQLHESMVCTRLRPVLHGQHINTLASRKRPMAKLFLPVFWLYI